MSEEFSEEKNTKNMHLMACSNTLVTTLCLADG